MNEKQLTFPDYVWIADLKMKVKQNRLWDGGSFDTTKLEIEIGTKWLKKNAVSNFNVICHEVIECYASQLGFRFTDVINESYVFHGNHKDFENLITLSSKTISEFLTNQNNEY